MNQQTHGGAHFPAGPSAPVRRRTRRSEACRVRRKNEIMGDDPILVSSLDNDSDLDKYDVRGVVLYR